MTTPTPSPPAFKVPPFFALNRFHPLLLQSQLTKKTMKKRDWLALRNRRLSICPQEWVKGLMTEGTDATGMTPRIGVKGLRLHHI